MFEKFSVRKPFTVLVGVVLVIVLGAVSFMNTQTDLLPSMNLPYAVVMTTYPGMTPEQVEADVTVPIEGRIGTVSGIDRIMSVSNEHFSVVILEFVASTNMDSASLEMRELLDQTDLPDGAGKPTILKLNPNMLPVMVSAVYWEGKTIHQLSALVSDSVAPAMEGVAGVASVSSSGLIHNQLNVILRQEKIDQVSAALAETLAGFAQTGMPGMEMPALPEQLLTVETVTGFLQGQNFSMPAGITAEDGVEYMVRVGDRFGSADEVSKMVLFDPGIGEPITLGDVAEVFASDNSATEYTRVNGAPAVMLTMQKQSEFSTSDVTNSILARMDELSEEQEGLSFAVLMDQGEYIDLIIDSVVSNLLWGGLLAILILILFLRDLRPTLLVGVSIPVSLMLAFTAMYFTGISLNIISMSGLALAVGMLVDNSIVVIENIYRLRSLGVPAKRAAIDGAKQVAGAIAASTLTTIAVFLPIVFTEGITRQLFTDLALTLAYSLLASLVVALSVVPAASSGIFRSMKEKEDKLYNRFRDWYGRLLGGSLKVKWLVLLIAVLLFVGSGYGILRSGTELSPAMDSPQLSVSVTLPEGTEFEQTVQAAEDVTARIREIADVETVGATVGGGGMAAMMGGLTGGDGATEVSMYILLEEQRTLTNEEVSQEIRDRTADLGYEVSVQGGSTGDLSALMGEGVSVSVSGRELDGLRDAAIEVADIIRSVEGTVDITDVARRAAPEWRIHVDKDAAMAKNLTVAQVYMAVSEALTEPEGTVSMVLSGVSYEVIVTGGDWEAPDRNGLLSLPISTPAGGTVLLSDIAEIAEDTGFTSINRQDGSRYITVSGEVAEGYNVGLVNGEIERLLADYTPPEGCAVTIGGQAEAISESFNDLYLMLALALVFIYLIMVAQFQSLLSPFIVMFTIPLAFTGGFAALLIAGMPLSVVGMVGLILLSGIVVNNGIVFVDCVNKLRSEEGMGKKEALVEAGRIRLRPILMTALTTIVAMSTMMFAVGQGTEMMQPMAISTVGGLLYATLMTLFVVPVMYDLFHKDKDLRPEEDSVDGDEDK
ncbi:MAG: efflux RND transporter permease subunit [Oscillospiraceae bacterium]|nr:efflux RND transporter permease subunit [Oscillospiraceae bacterium]